MDTKKASSNCAKALPASASLFVLGRSSRSPVSAIVNETKSNPVNAADAPALAMKKFE